MFKTGNELVVDALREVKPAVVTVLPGFPLNQAQNLIIAGALGEDVAVLNVATEADAVGIAIGAAQAGKKACAVIKDKGVNVAYQLIAEEVATPVVLVVGLDVDGRGSYVGSPHLPRVLEETGVINLIPMRHAEIYEAVKKSFEIAWREHRMVAVYVTEDLAMHGVSSEELDVIGEIAPEPPEPKLEDLEEAARALKLASSVALVVGKGCLGVETVKMGLPAWPSILGDGALEEVWGLADALKQRGTEVRVFCTKPASVFPQTKGMIPTGINTGNFVEAEVVVLAGVSYDMFGVKFNADYVISINVDLLAASMAIADLGVVGDAKKALSHLAKALRGG